MVQTSGAQDIAKKRYMKCTFCLDLVGAFVSIGTGATCYKQLVQVSPNFSAFL